MRLWWGKISARNQAEQIIFHSSSVLLCIAVVLIVYGIFHGVMAPGLTWLLFGIPDGGAVGAIPGILYGSLAVLLGRFRSRLAALGMLLWSCVMAFDNLNYHYLPIGLLPMSLVLWINFRAVGATFAWQQNKPSTPTISAQRSWRSNLNQAPWFTMIGALVVSSALGHLLHVSRTEWRMRGSITAPCEIVSKHENAPSLILGGQTSYGVVCKYRDERGEQMASGSIPKTEWDNLQVHDEIRVQYRSTPPYYKRVQVAGYEWVQAFFVWGAVIAVGIILFVRGLKGKGRDGNGKGNTPATTSTIAPQ